MPTAIRDTTTGPRRRLRHLHQNEQEPNRMDATTIRAAIGIAATALTLTLALHYNQPLHPEQSTPTTIGEPRMTPDLQAVDAAIADSLDQYLTSITTTTTRPRSAAAPAAVPAASTSSGDRWDQLAQCETGGNWATNTGNGFGGGLQFMHQRSYSTWLSFGGGDYAPHPWDATREQQIDIAEKVLASSGWNAWPGCSRKFGWL